MQRYFVAKEQIKKDRVILIGEDVKHISKVMRMKIGDEIVCSDGDSLTVRCEINHLTEDQVEAMIKEELTPNTELPIKVSIAQALPKGDKLEFIVQKGTELGATSFIPFTAGRSIVKWEEKKAKKKIDRLQKIAKEAAEQSYRERIPTITEAHTILKLLKKTQDFDLVIVAYEESGKSGEKANLHKAFESLSVGQSLLVIIGPEGGLTEEEVTQLEEKNALLCGLGPRILRTETASLYVLATISYHFELMK